MEAGPPDRDRRAPQPSLGAKLAAALRSPARAWELPAALCALIALGPLATIAGAQWITDQERAEAARFQTELEPRLAAEAGAQKTRAELAAAIQRPPLGSTLEALSRGLPVDAVLARAERTAQGALEIDVITADPDKLRATLRRDPALGRLRDTSQRQSDAMMIVSLREEAP